MRKPKPKPSRFFFDPESAEKPIEFIEKFCSLTKGRKNVKSKLVLCDFQKEIIEQIFGWMDSENFYVDDDGEKIYCRKHSSAHIWIAKKNGKSSLSAFLALYMLIADGEINAQIGIVSGSKEQSTIVFDEIKRLIQSNKHLSKSVQIFQDSIFFKPTSSTIKPLPAKAETLEGLDLSCLIIDEMHIVERETFNAIEYSNISRLNPLTIIISTAGDNLHSLGHQIFQTDKIILDPDDPTNDEHQFTYIKSADPNANIYDEDVWFDVNPGLGICCTLQSMRTAANQCKNDPYKELNFKRYRLNIWKGQNEIGYFPMEIFSKRIEDFSDKKLNGLVAFGGLDLSSTEDLSSFVLCFPPQEGLEKYHIKPFFWIPGDNVSQKQSVDKVPYEQWIEKNWVFGTEGNYIDHREISRMIKTIGFDYDIREIALDRAISSRVEPELMEMGFNTVRFGQDIMSISPPTKTMKELIFSDEIVFENNPCFEWNMRNAVVYTDLNENVKIHKQKSRSRVDGCIAAIMALSRSMTFNKKSQTFEYVSGQMFL